jgi:hypothetical protein
MAYVDKLAAVEMKEYLKYPGADKVVNKANFNNYAQVVQLYYIGE